MAEDPEITPRSDTDRISGSKGAGGAADAQLSTHGVEGGTSRLREHLVEALIPPPVPAAARLTRHAQPSQSTTRHRTEAARTAHLDQLST